MIIPIYKPLGASTHQLAKKCGELHHKKATHTGTLDPMAEGVVVVLTGSDRFDKVEHSKTKKTYEFEILLGATTDSHDLLGLITGKNQILEIDEEIQKRFKEVVNSFAGAQKQRIPDFSAKRIDGKSYFDKAKDGKEPPSYSEKINIYSIKTAGFRKISAAALAQQIIDKISLVEGDFRQKEIINSWEDFFSAINKKHFYMAKCIATTSRRTYIRGLVRDISRKINIPATTFSITRTANGPYTVQDCICLI